MSEETGKIVYEAWASEDECKTAWENVPEYYRKKWSRVEKAAVAALEERAAKKPCDPPDACAGHGRCWTHSTDDALRASVRVEKARVRKLAAALQEALNDLVEEHKALQRDGCDPDAPRAVPIVGAILKIKRALSVDVLASIEKLLHRGVDLEAMTPEQITNELQRDGVDVEAFVKKGLDKIKEAKAATQVPDTERGLYGKYRIERCDGSSAPGGKHADCTYFVLDRTHDPFATPALRAYADACEATHPRLAADLRAGFVAVTAERDDLATARAQVEALPTCSPGLVDGVVGMVDESDKGVGWLFRDDVLAALSTRRVAEPAEPDPKFAQSFDARDWAVAFVAHVQRNPSIATDTDTMLGWFSNAIMRGFDEHARRVAVAVPDDADRSRAGLPPEVSPPPGSQVSQTLLGMPTTAVGIVSSGEAVNEIDHMKCTLVLRDGREVVLADVDVASLNYEWRAKTGMGYKAGDTRAIMHEHTGEFKLFLEWIDKRVAAKYREALHGMSDVSEHW